MDDSNSPTAPAQTDGDDDHQRVARKIIEVESLLRELQRELASKSKIRRKKHPQEYVSEVLALKARYPNLTLIQFAQIMGRHRTTIDRLYKANKAFRAAWHLLDGDEHPPNGVIIDGDPHPFEGRQPARSRGRYIMGLRIMAGQEDD